MPFFSIIMNELKSNLIFKKILLYTIGMKKYSRVLSLIIKFSKGKMILSSYFY